MSVSSPLVRRICIALTALFVLLPIMALFQPSVVIRDASAGVAASTEVVIQEADDPATATEVPTETSIDTATSEPTSTETAIPPTDTAVAPTSTSVPPTDTQIPATDTPIPATSTATPSGTLTPSETATGTNSATATTTLPTSTPTPTKTPTRTPTKTPTKTPTRVPTKTATPTSVAVLSASNGYVGTTISVTLSRYPKNTSQPIMFDGSKVGSVAIGSNGKGAGTFRVPRKPYGVYPMVIGLRASHVDTQFRVRPSITIAESKVLPGQAVTITALGFYKNSTISFQLDAVSGQAARSLGTYKTGPDGSLGVMLTIPSNALAGTRTIRGTHSEAAAKDSVKVFVPTATKTPTRVPTKTATPKPRPTSTPKPPVHPPGATAICNDGTYSYSQHRRGTCSHHGGVREWLVDLPA